jgi:hypothetical protein
MWFAIGVVVGVYGTVLLMYLVVGALWDVVKRILR